MAKREVHGGFIHLVGFSTNATVAECNSHKRAAHDTSGDITRQVNKVGLYTTRVSCIIFYQPMRTQMPNMIRLGLTCHHNIQERPMQSSLYTKPPKMPEKQIQVQCYRRSQLCVRLDLTRAHDFCHHSTSLYRPIHPPSTVIISPET
jgi:hypothetical protein